VPGAQSSSRCSAQTSAAVGTAGWPPLVTPRRRNTLQLNKEADMAKVLLTLRGSPKDHVKISPELSDEEVEGQLKLIHDNLGAGPILLPWITVTGRDVIAAERVELERATRLR
jgi:hypothetical protein